MDKRKLHHSLMDRIWPFVEAIIAAVVGLVSILPPFNRPDVAITIWALGALYVISSVSIRRQIISELKDMFDEDFENVKVASHILSLYSEIQDQDLTQLKRESLTRCLTELENLSRGFAPDVRGTSFYMWFIDQFNKATKTICSVSSMPETYWVEYELERKSLQANYMAAKRGCDAKRIFIVRDKNQFQKHEVRQVIFEHLENNVMPLITFQDQMNDLALWEIVKDGFVIIDDRVLLVDTLAPPNTAGRMSKVPSEIIQYRKSFNQLELASIPATSFLENYLAEEIDKLEMQYGTLENLKTSTKKKGSTDDEKPGIINTWTDMITDREHLLHFHK